MTERDYLYLKGTEELGDIIDAIKEHPGKEIVLVIPRGTKSLLHPTNLEILKEEVDKLKKKIYFSSYDDRILSLGKQAGFDIFLEEYEREEAVKIVTDIIPPKKVLKPKILKKEKVEKQKTQGINFSKLFLYLFLIFIVGFGILISLNKFASSAVLEISLKSQKIDFDESLTLDPNAVSNDINSRILKAEYIEITKNHSIKQPTTGTKTGRAYASGKVIFKNLDPENSLSIIQGTRIKSKEGYIYRTTKRIYLEANKEAEVDVIADSPGEKYNIENDTEFTVPGLSGTRWEDKIQVKLASPIVVSEGQKVVTVDDINEGKIKLEDEIKKVIQNDLKLKYKDYLFPENAGFLDVKVSDVSNSVGQQASEIIITGSGVLKTVGIKQQDLANFIKDLFSKENLNKENVRIVNVDIESIKMTNFDLKTKKMDVTVTGKIEIQGGIDTKKLIEELKGKNISNAKEILGKYEEIEKAELFVYPFWSNNLPEDENKITVKIK
ncbi:MAG: baseplate J/gp47 family protein [Minisyncoccia bacterium]